MSMAAYPQELLNDGIAYTEFVAYGKEQGQYQGLANLFLPVVGNIAESNAAAYETKNIMAAADAVVPVLDATAKGGSSGAVDAIKRVATETGKDVRENAGEIAKSSASMVIDVATGGAAGYATRRVKNPNTKTLFTSNSIRQFAFNYTLMAQTPADTQSIKNIIQTFREHTYAESVTEQAATFLKYPPIWRIKFMTKDNKENPYIPRIFPSYLTSFTVTYNSTAGKTWFVDGAPMDVSISLTFQEARALTKGDVEYLNDVNKPLNVGKFDQPILN